MEAYLLTRGQRFLCKNGRAIGRGDSFNLLIALDRPKRLLFRKFWIRIKWEKKSFYPN